MDLCASGSEHCSVYRALYCIVCAWPCKRGADLSENRKHDSIHSTYDCRLLLDCKDWWPLPKPVRGRLFFAFCGGMDSSDDACNSHSDFDIRCVRCYHIGDRGTRRWPGTFYYHLI